MHRSAKIAPANALIESVTLDYRWEASSGSGSIRPIFRQDGTTVAGPETSASATDGWRPGSWQLTYNPVTGSNWTGADVDALEMGVETGALGNARLSTITVSVVYRTRKSSTVYIGGVYEKNLNADGTVAGVVEYYAAMGRTVAMRTVPAGGGAGTLVWPLLDQLGSTVAETDAFGNVLSRQDYWPYGTTRSVQAYAPVTETDRLYTGQQQEQGDPALGLYNYKARFYSTALGRFVSADTVADGLDRYEYVHDNPVRYNDPSGTCVPDGHGGYLPCTRQDMVQFFSCAWGGECDAGDQTDAVRAYARGVIQSNQFKYFVGLESAANGDIVLTLTVSAEIHGAGRKVPAYGSDRVGTVTMSVEIDATKREFLPYTSTSFSPGRGKDGFLDGWGVQYANNPIANPHGVDIELIAGPQDEAGGIGAVVPCLSNPFACSDVHADVNWDLSFDSGGALTVNLSLQQTGSLVGGIPGDIPDLLVLSNVTYSVEEVPILLGDPSQGGFA